MTYVPVVGSTGRSMPAGDVPIVEGPERVLPSGFSTVRLPPESVDDVRLMLRRWPAVPSKLTRTRCPARGMVIGSDEPPTVIVALIASESSKSKDSVFAYSGSSTIVYVPVTGKGSQEMRRLDGELSRLTAGGRERRRPAGPPGGTQGTPGAARALRASVDRAGRDRADRPPRDPAPGARDPPPLGRLAGDAAAGGSRGAGDPPEPRRRPDRPPAPPRGSRLRVLRAGSFGRLLAGTTSPVSVVTPAGFATVGAHRHVLGTFRVA